jgi:hypothetical protein
MTELLTAVAGLVGAVIGGIITIVASSRSNKTFFCGSYTESLIVSRCRRAEYKLTKYSESILLCVSMSYMRSCLVKIQFIFGISLASIKDWHSPSSLTV